MEQQINFPNHLGEKLAATLHPAPGSSRSVILGHCFTCSRHTAILRHICHALAGAGYMVLRFDFSGNGQSEGIFAESTHSKQVAEIKIAASFVAQRGARWIGLAGHSMGALVALLAAAQEKKIRAVCTLAAPASVIKPESFLSDSQRQELQRTGRVTFTSRGRQPQLTADFFADTARYDLPEMIDSLQVPVLVIHGDRDEIVPVEAAQRLHQFNPKQTELAIISGADHMFSKEEHRRQVTGLVVRWFEKQAGR